MSDPWRAEQLDAADRIAGLRERFSLPADVIYLDGNSLGPLPAHVAERVDRTIREEWGRHLIAAWTSDGWWSAPTRVGDRIGRLIGAAPGQTVVGDSTSVQLFNALVAAARLRPGRGIVVIDSIHFPTDRYMAASVARLLDLRVIAVPAAALDATLHRYAEDIAVVAFGAVDYRTGELHDIATITRAVHHVGAVAVWDLCHAVGAVPLDVDTADVDLAVGCTYKYLCGGPGAPAFIYVAQRHQAAFDHPLIGWNGHMDPFAMETEYRPSDGIARARIGTPHILSLSALDAALDVFDDVDIGTVREKSLGLADYFLDELDEIVSSGALDLVTPREHSRRGNQLTFRYDDADAIEMALRRKGIICDVRPPNLVRFAFNGLFLSYADIHRAADSVRGISHSTRE
ncbi:kynureninase [Nocardia sp. NPDC051787]|uniref:kynureninase n=1 Tax=Nocardia sp. NPDC051787 TaxID=3155415 RepID=UPI0034243F6B